ncbi:OmpA family protein [Maribacter confluentis]|uniref:OmpA family protein n=1 Tax=Maribacter confluentis TaxID=1656093 RepID=A0ABT8RRL7_9FLAO|nr:OmpA family protein [Maribacter confluentis]MDO1513519.1 OmpA family protein [Maribacter confluentis]
MNYKLYLTILFFLPFSLLGQQKKSKADDLFYAYQYEKAIAEYKSEMAKRSLSNVQLLNLADAYFQTGKFDDASKLYLDVNKNDTIMTVNQFNKLLQSLSKNSERERVKTFLRSKADKLSPELLENAEFNYSLLEIATDNSNTVIEGIGANSAQGDFSPTFYKDGLLFSSSRLQKSKSVYEPSGESYLDIYYGKLSTDGELVDVRVFDKIPDSRFHKSTPYYSEKYASFYYILSNTENDELAYDENGKNALAIGILTDSGKFRFLLKDLSTSFYYPFLDDTTGRLYFAANFDDSYGGTDLYYVYTNNGQIVSAPKNLGPRINSPGNEISPYIHNGSLYFSSDIFYGYGGMDIYKSNMLEGDAFTIPVNLGNGINTVADDFGFIIKEGADNNSLTGYFSSNRNEGKGGDDLYRFSLKNTPGLKTFTLKGKVVNLTNKVGLDKVSIKLLDREGEVLKETFSTVDGDYRIEVPWSSQITVQTSKDGYSQLSTTYSEDGMEDLQNKSFNMGLVKLEDLLTNKEDKTILKLDKFYFDEGKSTMNAQVETELNKVVDAVMHFPSLRMVIENHTDSRGSSAYNKKLSTDRANTIKNYLLQKGVSPNNIVDVVGFGEEKIKNNCTNGAYCLDFLHKQNERTLIVVVDK